MPAYVVVNIDVKNAEPYEEYKRLASESIAKFGGRYIVRGGKTEVLEGNWTPKRYVMLEFPTVARAKEWFNSPEYGKAKAVRQSCADAEMIVVEGL